ncbi:uncharacterized protein LOC134814265 [Bolinopsis microptera]|uniref:uncharacterized protein LOC134814265 n=1 Tax=Bolinopsis microptera TaxID=2820187 RepID=UPI00307AA81B
MTIPTSQGFISQPGDMDIRASYCGTLYDDIKPENKCNSVKEKFDSLSDTLYAVSMIGFENIEIDCGMLDICEENCVYEEHRPKKKGLAWWGILLIVILIISFVAVISFLLYCIFCRKCAVNPKDDEAGIFYEQPTVVRLTVIERYLDDAIASKHMADLKLTIDIIEQEGFQEEHRQKYDTAVRLLKELMARDAEIKRKELEEEERKADETKKDLEEAENDILRQHRANKEVTLRRAIKARDEAKVRWARMWPKLEVLRSLNGMNVQLTEKAMEEARKAKEDEEKQRKFEEVQAKEGAYCKQLLKEGIAAADEGKLEEAMKTTDWTVFQTTIMDTDEELRDLHIKARNELERIRSDSVPLIVPLLQREKEAEEKRREEEKIAKTNRKEEETLEEVNRQEEERTSDTYNIKEKRDWQRHNEIKCFKEKRRQNQGEKRERV